MPEPIALLLAATLTMIVLVVLINRLIWRRLYHLAEVRFPIYRKFGGILFLDLGNVWREALDFNPVDLRATLGCGARFHSPLGILRVDYGLKLDRRPGESLGEFYFSLGQAF
ncbi:MAG: BamA/TamA family outer membrane protein [candidate division KSB1 bacterium]|nr:BamA/TamA family outer membrane protein [candidate division KSB1 bacterium]